MALGYIFHHESALGKQFFRGLRDFLAMLKRTSRVIGDDDIAMWLLLTPQIDAAEILRDVLCQRRNLRRRACEIAVLAQHEAVVLDHRAAPRCRHQDGVETVLLGFLEPDADIGARPRQRIAVASEMMGQRTATLLVLDQHDLDAVTRQDVDGGLVDARRQNLLGAALKQRNTSAPGAKGRKNASAGGSRRWQATRRQR